MNWWVVTGSNDKQNEAVVCEERALNWVRDDLREIYPIVKTTPATCHWTAEIRFPTEPDDVDGIEEW